MPRLALGAIVAVMAGLAVFALWQTMSATDEVDRERTSVAINAMLLNHVQRLEIYTAEQAYSDEVAAELYTGKAPDRPLADVWNETSLSDEHQIAFAHDRSGQYFAIESGEPSATDFAKLYASAIKQMTALITDTSDCVGAIIWTANGPHVLTVARVRSISSGIQSGPATTKPIYISLAKHIDDDALAHIGKSLGISGIKIALAPPAASGTATTKIVQQAGPKTLWLEWQPARPGQVALTRSLPPLIVVLICGIGMVFLLSRLIAKLLSSSLRDTLSHLPNRRALELRISRGSAKGNALTMALIDLDGFKRINDTNGTRIGDQAIRAVADLLIKLAPTNATVARIGGDEFAVLAEAGREEMLHSIENFLQRLSETITVSNVKLHLSATVGLAQAQGEQTLFVESERALASAKQRCRGAVLIYTEELDHAFKRQASLAEQVDRAIDCGLLNLHFQPLARASDGHIEAVESLLRWKPEADIKAGPEEVITAAELHGLGSKLAYAILDSACSIGAQWPDIRLAVNVTPSQFLDPDLVPRITDMRTKYGLSPGQLELEVTESIAIADEAVFSQQFEQLRASGVSLALDDFGSGFASIGFLRRYPFQKLKLDKTLIVDAESSAGCLEMLVACVAAARALSIKTVAEGIETTQLHDLSRAAGCDFLQGYYIARPMAEAAFAAFVDAQRETGAQVRFG